MRLATLRDGTPDGRLIAVSSDRLRAAFVEGVPSLQAALDRWCDVQPMLIRAHERVEAHDSPATFTLDHDRLMAPLPRAWQWLDGSAYPNHGALMQRAFDLPPIETDRPLMYQGLSDTFLAGTEDVPLPSEADGIDFEGEFGVITGRVPLGTAADEAMDHIRLIVQINDWSLRAIAPIEMKTGFGWIQAKPACSVAPIAVTPNELGDAWSQGRIDLSLRTLVNGTLFGDVPGADGMEYGFHELIAHAARTRSLPAGTIIGSGTVSSARHADVGSSCIAERRAIEMIAHGAPQKPFLSFGDSVRMEVLDPKGRPVFGILDQRVVEVRSA